MRILVAMPVFNELRSVGAVLDRVGEFSRDILVVDDGSTDGTSALLAARADIQTLRHPVNRGYGQSLIDAFDYAGRHGYDWVVTMDCDGQHEPETLPQFERLILEDRFDIISGSRYLENRPDDDLPPGDRRLINATVTRMLNDMLGLNITDAFCGFKAHRVAAMRRLELDEAGYAFPLQLWPQAARAGLRIIETPVRLIYNDPNRSFGGVLDDAQRRLHHYLDVFKREMSRPLPQFNGADAIAAPPELSVCSCCQ